MIQGIVVDPAAAEQDFTALKLLVYGSAPMAADVVRRAVDVFGCDFAQAYGMTECCAVATILAPEDHRRALRSDPELLASAGRPVMGSAVKVVSRDGVELPAGAVGEVLVHGEQLMSGYWGLDDATHTTLVDGWLHTGDAGHLDEEGFLFISDRVKDMIISGGENIYPREIEEVLFGLDGIADAAVVGVPSDKWGESPVAVVVLAPGSVVAVDESPTRLGSRAACPAAHRTGALARDTAFRGEGRSVPAGPPPRDRPVVLQVSGVFTKSLGSGCAVRDQYSRTGHGEFVTTRPLLFR
ncbi:AMP-binding protein [Gordonia sp. SCSIO 19800]|uniref:AMP-binding protein n=1 Tax=Gordonia sp. SCSIO 19800 TaxID=2826926 RepID=UPI0020115407|nr:AMP-binding protein [Gordonia sp. SCSIO 19800]